MTRKRKSKIYARKARRNMARYLELRAHEDGLFRALLEPPSYWTLEAQTQRSRARWAALKSGTRRFLVEQQRIANNRWRIARRYRSEEKTNS
jgi:hypothetical protein